MEYNFSDIELETAVQQGTRPSIPADCLPEFKLLMTQCWSGEPAKRMNFDQIVMRVKAMLTTHAPTAVISAPQAMTSSTEVLSRSGRGLIGVSRAANVSTASQLALVAAPPPGEPTKQIVVEGKFNKQISGTIHLSACTMY